MCLMLEYQSWINSKHANPKYKNLSLVGNQNEVQTMNVSQRLRKCRSTTPISRYQMLSKFFIGGHNIGTTQAYVALGELSPKRMLPARGRRKFDIYCRTCLRASIASLCGANFNNRRDRWQGHVLSLELQQLFKPSTVRLSDVEVMAQERLNVDRFEAEVKVGRVQQ